MQHFPIPRTRVNRVDCILDACQGRRVLHLGAADHPYTDMRLRNGDWLHSKITAAASHCLGIELDPAIVTRLAADHGITNLRVGNAERLGDLALGQWDVVVAGEIIEHLNCPGDMFAGVAKLLAPGGEFVISTTNAYCLRRCLRLVVGTESIHPDHVAFYSHRTLAALAGRYGFTAARVMNYSMEDRRHRMPWLFDRLASLMVPSWGEGIIHAYRLSGPQ